MHQPITPRRARRLFLPPANETYNALTHATGLALSLPAVYLLVRHARNPADFWSCLVFGLTLIAVYAASTCVHIGSDRRLRYRLEVLDHSAIYLLIGGTFTPFFVLIGGTLGAWLLVIGWAMALAGVGFKIGCGLGHERLSIASYIVLGWFPLMALRLILQATSWPVVVWLVLGGAAYTAGVPFYLASRNRFGLHPVWHLFVMLGSACHYLAIWLAITPRL